MNKSIATLKRLGNTTWFRAVVTITVCTILFRSGINLWGECTLVPNFYSIWFAAACILALVYRVTNAYGWALVLRAMRQKIDGSKATKIWLLAESRRWLPGGVWGYASRATMASEIKVSASVASVSMILELALTLIAALVVTIPVGWIWRAELESAISGLQQYTSKIWVLAFVTVTLAFACLLFRNSISNKWFSLKRKMTGLRHVSFSKSGLVFALFYLVLMAGLNGIVTTCLVWSMPTDTPPVLVVIAANSLAWVVGFLAIFAPGGLFVREAVFAFCLSLWVPYSTGIAIAVLARLLQIGAEFAVMFFVGFDWSKLLRVNKRRLSALDCIRS